MNARFSPLFAAIAAALSSMPVAVVQAAGPVTLDDVVVTATRTERSVRDVPAAVSIIDRKEIEASPAITVDQLLQGTPGVYAARMDISAPNRIAQTYVRGLPGNGRSLVLVDGVPMNVLYDSQVDWSQLSTLDVGRVEVVRGAGSALYGNSAMGGVVNIISRNLEPGTHGRAELAFGGLDTKRVAGSVSQQSGDSGFALSASYLNSGGYNMWRPDTSAVQLPVSQRAVTGSEKTNFAGRYQKEIDGSNLLDIGVSYLRDLNTGLYNIADYIPQDREQYLGSVRYRHFGETSETSVLLYSRFGLMAADSANALNATSPDVSAPGTPAASRISYRGDFFDRSVGLNVQSSHALSADQKLTVGGEYVNGYMSMRNRYPAEPGRAQVTEGDIRRSALFVQDEIRFGPVMTSLAGRFDRWETSGEFRDTKAAFPGQGSWDKRSESAFSPKAGLAWRITDAWVLRGSVGKAFNTPDISQLYGNSRRGGTVIAYGNPYLTPEKALSRDLGLDYYFGNRGHVKSTVYYTTAEDFIYTVNRSGAPAGLSITDKQNVGEVRAKGLELEGLWRLTDALNLQASFTWNDSTVTSNPANTSLEGKQLVNVPKRMGFLKGDWQITEGLSTFVAVNHVGDRFSNDANTTLYAGYTTWDVGISKALDKQLTVRFSGINLSDKKYEGIGYMAPGRVLTGSLIARF